jgi:uncharacterized protein YbjT (DUF2867 family)
MIVITAPTGRIGSQLLADLIEDPETLRVIVRDRSRLPSQLRERVEIVTGTHADPAVVNQAFAGADAVFWLVPADSAAPSPRAAYLDFSQPALEAFRSHGIKHVVGISALGRGTEPAARAGHVTATLELDDAIAATGVNYRALTMPSFMDNLLGQAASIAAEGVIRWTAPADLKAPMCSTGDIARAAATLLTDRSWSGTGQLAVLGPEDISMNEVVEITSEVLGRPVSYQQAPVEAFRQRLLGFGMSEAMAQSMVDMLQAKNEGLDNGEPRTAQSSTPTSYRQWCTEVLKPAVLAAEAA